MQLLWMVLVMGQAVMVFSKTIMSQKHARELKKHIYLEKPHWLYGVYDRLPIYIAPLAYLEYLQGFWPQWPIVRFLSLGILLIGFGLHMWSVYSLGTLWNQSCLVVDEMRKVVNGPYRWFRHPEYLGRFLEGLGLIGFLSSFGTAIAYVITAFLVFHRLGAMENELLGSRGLAFPPNSRY